MTTMLNVARFSLHSGFSPPTEMVNGTLRPIKENRAVSQEVLLETKEWKELGLSEDDWIERLRLRTVPPGYTPCPWSGMLSTTSSLATFD